MRRFIITTAAGLATALTATMLLLGGDASAHFNTVSCQSPGVWQITNSEVDKTETFTTDQGHSGSIGAGGSTTVAYSGNSLTVFGVWSNGFTATNTGQGDCTVVTTTQETTTSTPTSTSSAPSTTPPTTTSNPTTTQEATTSTTTSTSSSPSTSTVTSSSTPPTTSPSTTSPSTSEVSTTSSSEPTTSTSLPPSSTPTTTLPATPSTAPPTTAPSTVPPVGSAPQQLPRTL